MRILQVGSSMARDWGGIERYITHLSSGLAQRGHEVVVTAPFGSPLAGRATVPVHHIELKSRFDPLALAAYLRLFRSQSFDLLNVHFSPDYRVPALAARIAKGPRTVLTRHLAIGYGKRRARSLQKLYDHVVAVSGAVRQELVEASGFPDTFVTTAHAGVPRLVPNHDQASARRVFGIDARGLQIGMFGRLTKEKGHAAMLDILRRVPNAHLHVFGEGPLRAELQRLASGQPVTFYGQIEDVADAVNAMDLVAMPSLWAEAFSIAALEACSLGRPLVASPRGGLPELVRHGETGFLADPESDPTGFAACLNTLADDPSLRQAFGNAAQELHAREFTVERFAERMEAVYERTVS